MSTLRDLNEKIFDENKRITGVVGLVIIFIIIGFVFSFEAGAIKTDDAKSVLDELRRSAGGGAGGGLALSKTTVTKTGSTNENEKTDEEITITERLLKEVSATLTWTDTDPGVGRTNQPDSFRVGLSAPNGETITGEFAANADQITPGTATVTMRLDENIDNTGDWTVTVEAGDCGDITFRFGLVTVAQDTGNDWSLTFHYSFLA